MSEHTEDHWLILNYPGNGEIRLDVRIVDRIFATDGWLVLEIDGLGIRIAVSDSTTAAHLARELACYTRFASKPNPSLLDDLRRRVDLAREGKPDGGTFALLIADRDLHVDEEYVYCSERPVCSILDLVRYAEAGTDIPVGADRVQASLVLLLVAARKRPPDDLKRLDERIRELGGNNCT